MAMLLMLASAALFVYLRLRADLDDRIDASLRSRVVALVEPQGEPSLAGVALEDPEETFVQLLSPTGEVLDSVGTLRGPALSPAETQRAAAGTVSLERALNGVDGRARLLARLRRWRPDGRGRGSVAVGPQRRPGERRFLVRGRRRDRDRCSRP
ncbi:MAG: hypothetical protein WKF47_08235 [Geodermatophilaceae bacterium]